MGQAGDFDDVSKVEKYEMSADNYSKRTGECESVYIGGLNKVAVPPLQIDVNRKMT